MIITSRIVEDFLNCKYKAYLALRGETGTPHDYEVLMNELAAISGHLPARLAGANVWIASTKP